MRDFHKKAFGDESCINNFVLSDEWNHMDVLYPIWHKTLDGFSSPHFRGLEVADFDRLDVLLVARRARQRAKALLTSIDPKLKVTFRGKDSYHVGKTINLSLSCITGKGEHNADFCLDIVQGLALHEVSHHLFTSAEWFKGLYSRLLMASENIAVPISKYYEDRTPDEFFTDAFVENTLVSHHPIFKLTKVLWNIIEDERIERLLCDTRKFTYREKLACVKKHYFSSKDEVLYVPTTSADYENWVNRFRDKFIKMGLPEEVAQEKAENAVEEQSSVFNYLHSFILSVVRYPKNLDYYHCDRDYLEEETQAIVDILLPYPKTPEEVEIAAVKIMDEVLAKYMVYDIESKGEKAVTKSDLEKAMDELPRKSGSGKVGSDGESDDDFDDLGTEEEIEEEIASYGEDVAAREEVEDAPKPTPSSKKGKYKDGSVEGHREVVDDVVFERKDASEGQYLEDYAEVCSYITPMVQALSFYDDEYQRVNKGMRNGNLDSSKLAEAVAGSQSIYMNFDLVKTEPVALGLLVDESGSMMGSCIDYARKAAVLFCEVFDRLRGVDTFIYGHTTTSRASSEATLINIYKEPSFDSSKYVVGSIDARRNNIDGTAILYTAKRMAQQTKAKKKILFVISDGEPSAYRYSGEEAINDTRDKVIEAERMGFVVIQIAITEFVRCERMFRNFVKFTDIPRLPKSIAMLVKKVIS